MSENGVQVQPVSWINNLSKNTRFFLKGGIIVGTACIACRTVYKSKKFHDLLQCIKKWGADQKEKFNWFDSDDCPLFDLPDSIRQTIFEYVQPSDLKSLRLTCKTIQFDLDYQVGLYVLLGNNEQQQSWVGSIVAQGVHITSNMHGLLDNCETHNSNCEFISRPGYLKRLHIDDTFPISSENFAFILSRFPTLEDLTVHVMDDEFATLGYNDKILGLLLKKQQQLRYLRVQYQKDTQLCTWEMRFETAETVKALKRAGAYQYPDNQPTRLHSVVLNFEHFEGLNSANFAQTRVFWQRFLEKQTELRRLCCNYGLVCWDMFAEVIDANAETIRRIQLQDVSNWEFWSAQEDRETPFDWNFFLKTKKLENLKLQFEGGENLGPLKSIPIQFGQIMNLTVLFLDTGVVFWKIYQSIIWANKGTLQEVHLLRLTAFNPSPDEVLQMQFFDWGLFKDCEHLVRLVIGGLYNRYLIHQNLSLLPFGLVDLKLYYVMLTSEDCFHIAVLMPTMTAGYDFLEFCDVYGLDRRVSPLEYITIIQEQAEETVVEAKVALEQCLLLGVGLLASVLFLIL